MPVRVIRFSFRTYTEYGSQIQFTIKVQKTGRFLTLFVNCIYSMNICQFSEPYLYWRIQFTNKVLDFICELYLFDEYLPVFFLANTVQKYSPQIRFSSLFVNCIGKYSSEIKSRTLTFNDRSLMNLIRKHQNRNIQFKSSFFCVIWTNVENHL